MYGDFKYTRGQHISADLARSQRVVARREACDWVSCTVASFVITWASHCHPHCHSLNHAEAAHLSLSSS